MTCSNCHREVAAEKRIWTGIQRWARMCLYCGALLLSTILPGQISPPEKGPPVMIDVRAPSIYGNASAQTITYDSARRTVLRLPAAVNREHWGLSKADFQLSPADKARLRSRKS